MHIHIHLCRLNRKIQHENRKFPNQQLCFIRILHRSGNHGVFDKSAVDEKIFIIAVRAAKFRLPNQSADGIFPLVVGNGEHAVCRILPVNIKYRRFRVIVPCRMQNSIAVIDIMNRNLRMPQCDFVHQIRNIAAFGRRLFQKFSARRHVVKKIPHRNGSALPAGGILQLLYFSGMNHNARTRFLVSGFCQHFHLRHRRDTRQCFAAKAQCKNMLQILNL